ncbi:hypothetical protein Sjap_012846 [Stephania japonica]|uniref:Uncharacterized protein n=1 Tax=Stephania japonica TaxID=461633 RepID=A0AAP0IWV1_9MAGN
MSLVDYASSSSGSDDEDDKHDEESRDIKHEESTLAAPLHSNNQSVCSSSQHSGGHSHPSSSTTEKLPDASLLLNSHSSLNSTMKLPDASLLLNSPSLPSHQFSGNDHSSRVAAAIEKNARKRELNVSASSASSLRRGKLPKGNLPHLKNVSNSDVGLLVPPQLSGRFVSDSVN